MGEGQPEALDGTGAVTATQWTLDGDVGGGGGGGDGDLVLPPLDVLLGDDNPL